MCYHVSNQLELDDVLDKIKRKIIPKRRIIFKRGFIPVRYDPIMDYKKGYDLGGFEPEKPVLPVIVNLSAESVDFFQWGLIPEWVKDPSTWKANTLNARNDEFFEKPSYKQYWQNRCLIFCTGVYEPHYPDLAGRYHESWYIKAKDKDYLFIGGVYAINNGVPTVTMITTEPTPKMRWIKNDGERQLLYLQGENAKRWLQPDVTKDEMKELMKINVEDKDIVAYKVMDGIYNSRKDTNIPEAVEIIPDHETDPSMMEYRRLFEY